MGKLFNVTWFAKFEALKYSTIVVLSCIGLEILQLLIPWRNFNPIDMMYNIIGGILTLAVIWAPVILWDN